MKINIGSELNRGIILKHRQRLKSLLAVHEVMSADDYRDNAHMLLLIQLCEAVEKENERYKSQAYPE